MTISEDNKTVLMAANGNRMAITGKTTIHMQANGVQATSEILVSPDIVENMLVSCQDLVKLQVIPKGFPNQRIQWCQSTGEFKNILINEFAGVLSDDLNPEPMKSEKPMHILSLIHI